MVPSAIYTADDVAEWLSDSEVAKAQSYLDKVADLDVGDTKISAKVQGTAPRPYRVQVTLGAGGHAAPLRAQCSCPVGSNCKHVAATLLAAIDAREAPRPVSAPGLGWLAALQQLAAGPATAAAPAPAPKQPARLYWVLAPQPDDGDFRLTCYKGRSDASGQPQGRLAVWSKFEQALGSPYAYVDDDDLFVIRQLLAQGRRDYQRSDFSLHGSYANEVLDRLLASGRLLTDARSARPLHAAAPRPARLEWRQDEQGRFRARAVTEPAIAWALPLDPPRYVDLERGEAGVLDFATPAALTARVLAAPPLSEDEARRITAELAAAAPEVPPPALRPARVIDVAPLPQLRLATLEVAAIHKLRSYESSQWGAQLDVAQPSFVYDGIAFALDDHRELVTLPDGEPVQVRRRPDEEARWLETLKDADLLPMARNAIALYPATDLTRYWVLADEEAWLGFMVDTLPALRGQGWDFVIPEDFRHHFLEVEEWSAEITENEGGWFNLDMGIMVDGQRLALAPLLGDLFHSDRRWLDTGKLARIANRELIDLFTPDGKRIRVRAERIKPLAQTLIDLFDRLPQGAMRVSALDAPRLATMAVPGWRVEGLSAVQRMVKKLEGLAGVTPVEPPAGFALELRPYQREGLAWLQYLREHELAGILADDMGLGKTAQTLAHLLLEKEAGRLDKPALIVLPTSLIFNWQSEASRFAPALRLLSLHGKARKERFADIPQHDVVLTSYPLLWRDAKELAQHEYHMLILDEAQTVKNAASQSATVVRQLKATHRLCLTGTPLENHLGELWSQFDFLLPGFLGDAKSFTRTWRTPIEKYGNGLRAELLARRIRPFILRRRKEDVAKELPPKTLIPRTVELDGGQRDLYEAVRSAMDKRVRDEIAARGFARSQIVILDALLKLRQVCCDPRLVNSAAAQKVKERAKLDQLMDMLPELVEEGRKVLVFSQFTGMLALIEAELKQAALPYALLTGATQDRAEQIRRFQDGEVPIFLISLKAGGVGLNLTAADTVIHYDPWWNPAVENQATDRAHRLGQTKPVFVYKLIVAGSIEEKIVAMQEQKAELARHILSDDGAGTVKFSEADIQALLAPLPPAA